MIQLLPLLKFASGLIGFIFLTLTFWCFTPEVSVTGGIISALFSILFLGITYGLVKAERKLIAAKDFAVTTAGNLATDAVNKAAEKLS